MAGDVTSVGAIQLDVEINQESLNMEMDKLGKAFSNNFKSMFSGMVGQTNNFVKNSIGRMTSSFTSFARTGTGSNEKVSQSVGKMNAQYDKTQEKIREINAELSGLYAKQDSIAAKYADFPTLSGSTKGDTIEALLGTDTEYQKLSAEAAKLEARLDPLALKSKELSAALNESGKAAQKTGVNLGGMGSVAKKTMGPIFKLTWLKKMLGNEARKASSATSGLSGAFNRMSRAIVRNLITYGLVIKGLKSMISYVWSALKTNDQFTHSLNIIKTNLMVAFQPIYDFILPAINALMRAIATVTTYIASAISALFGKTYKQSFGAAKSIETAKKAMGGFGKATKKAGKDAKGALAPFDEINQLSFDKGADADGGGSGGGGAGDFEMTMPDLSVVDMGIIDNIKARLAGLFEPFKASWANEGQKTIESIKHAFSGIGSLLGEIGKSFQTVWAGGSGQRILELIYRTLQNTFGLIGDIGYSFAAAWKEGDKGTEIMKKLFNVAELTWETVEMVTGAFRQLWGAVGDSVARTTIDVLYGIAAGLEWVATKIRDVVKWTLEGGLNEFGPLWETTKESFIDFWKSLESIWESIKNLFKSLEPIFAAVGLVIAGVVGVIIGLFNGIVSALGPIIDAIVNFVDMIINVFYSIVLLLQGEFAGAWEYWQKAVDNSIKFVQKLWEGVYNFFEKFVRSIVDFFHGLYMTLVGNSIIPDMVNAIVKWFKDMIGWVTKPVKDLVNLVVSFFTNLFSSIGSIWNNIRNTTANLWNGIKNSVVNVANTIKGLVSSVFTGLGNIITGIWNNIKTVTSTVWNNIKSLIMNPINTAKTAVKNALDAIMGFFKKLKIPEIKIPKIKLPHFKLTGQFSLAPPQVPKLNIDWYDKGGIFTGPQIIGVGEKRPEFVGALDDLRQIVRDEMGGTGQDSDLLQRIIDILLRILDALLNNDGDTILKIGETDLGRATIKAINKVHKQEGRLLLDL